MLQFNLFSILICFIVITIQGSPIQTSTIILVGKNCSNHGGVLLTQSIEDVRKNKFLFKYNADDFAQKTTRKLIAGGEIPQSGPTYSYYYTEKGTMNEHKLMIASSTCKAKTFPEPSSNATPLIGIVDLVQILSERCNSSRDAIKTLGELVMAHGFYGEKKQDGAVGESIAIADANEGWIVNILPDPTHTAGIWVAQRVPERDVAVIANVFTIRRIELGNTRNFMASDNVFNVAKEYGLWNNETPFDFTDVYSDGELHHAHFGSRRMWRIYDLLAPSFNLSPETPAYSLTSSTYLPFSIEPEKKLSMKNLFAFQRDHFEGTVYDLTQGIAAGPFNSPYRYATSEKVRSYQWEQSICTVKTTYSIVMQTANNLPNKVGGVFWYAPAQADSSAFVPFFTGGNQIPEAYSVGGSDETDTSSMWKLTNFISTWSNLQYADMQRSIRRAQIDAEARGEEFVEDVQNMIAGPLRDDPRDESHFIDNVTLQHAASVLNTWQKLAKHLVESFNHAELQKFAYTDSWSKRFEKQEGVIPIGEMEKVLPNEQLERVSHSQGKSGNAFLDMTSCKEPCCKVRFVINDTALRIQLNIGSSLMNGGPDGTFSVASVLRNQGTFDFVVKGSHGSQLSNTDQNQNIIYGIRALDVNTSEVIGISRSTMKEGQRYMEMGENYANVMGLMSGLYKYSFAKLPEIDVKCGRNATGLSIARIQGNFMEMSATRSDVSWFTSTLTLAICGIALLLAITKLFAYSKRISVRMMSNHQYQAI